MYYRNIPPVLNFFKGNKPKQCYSLLDYRTTFEAFPCLLNYQKVGVHENRTLRSKLASLPVFQFALSLWAKLTKYLAKMNDEQDEIFDKVFVKKSPQF